MSDEKFPAVVLFGPPGVGKGTQGKILREIPGFEHVSSGEIFRNLDPSSPAGREVASFASRGELVPDDVTIRIFRSVIEKSVERNEFDPTQELLLLDGIPRTRNQAEILAESFEVLGIVQLAVKDENVTIQRLRRRAITEHRADDANEQTIRHRFAVYRQETAPLLEYYDDDVIHTVDAESAPVVVLCDILNVLVPIWRGQFESSPAVD